MAASCLSDIEGKEFQDSQRYYLKDLYLTACSPRFFPIFQVPHLVYLNSFQALKINGADIMSCLVGTMVSVFGWREPPRSPFDA